MAVLTACTGTPRGHSVRTALVRRGGHLYRLQSGNGASMDIIDYGCRVVRICVPATRNL